MIHQNQISYVYIYKFHFIEDLDITFDPHYKFELNRKERTLKISKNPDFPESFWGNHIYSMSGILGDNGSGKSTIISFLMEALIDGSGISTMDALIIYNNNNELRLYNHGDIKIYTNNIKIEERKKILKIKTFYYTPYFSPESYTTFYESTTLAGSYNASLASLLISDLENYLNQSSNLIYKPFIKYINCHIVENDNRICTMLSQPNIREILKDYCVPKYITIKLNNSGYEALETSNKNSYLQLLNYNFKRKNQLERYQEEMIYNCILNIFYETNLKIDVAEQILLDWHKEILTAGDLFIQFQLWVTKYEFPYTFPSLKSHFTHLANCLVRLHKLAHNINTKYNAFYFFDIDRDSKNILEIIKLSRNPHFITSRYFDLCYAQSISDGNITFLSSGELDLLNFYSRIYDAVITTPKRARNIKAPKLLIIDEGENSFHPEWQRKYIDLLVSFLNKIADTTDHTFQVILTSHSPMILSDFPSETVNYLKMMNGKITNQRNNMTCTFAQNVFELYNNSFFMQNGLIGEFAKKKLQLIEKKLLNHTKKDVLKEIKLVGDERIKNYLLGLYYKDNSSKMIEYYEEQIRVLKGRKDRKNE